MLFINVRKTCAYLFLRKKHTHNKYCIHQFTMRLTSKKEIEKFFAEHHFAAADRAVKQGVETVRRNAAWLNTAREGVAAWLKAHGY